MALDLSKFIERFVEEARDHLSRLAEGLAALERDPADKEVVTVIFRSAHTIKGSSKMLKLTSINETAHKLEDVLDALRNGSQAFTPSLAKVLYRAVDALSDLVERLSRGEALPAADDGLVKQLERTLDGGTEEAPVAIDHPAEPEPEAKLKAPDTVRVRLAKLDELIKLMNEVISSHSRNQQRLLDLRSLERLKFPPGMDDQARLAMWQQELHRLGLTMREDVAAQDLLVQELHRKALILRMLPLAMVFDPVGRMVRDIAQTLGKDVDCVITGSEIELDRQMIDALGDPILHLIRNSLDHGIEPPEGRRAQGKSPRGRICLGARQDGAWVVVEVSDDGGGIPVSAIREKALRKGLVTADKLATMGDREVTDLIFVPGFSTSPIITDLSGRGVGLDVVKSSIEGLRGVVSVDSRPGQGTVFSLRLPLSLAVMRILLIRSGGLSFGFTSPFVIEILRSEVSEFLVVAGRRVVILRNEFIPVVSLQRLLGLPDGQRPEVASSPLGALLLVVGVQHEKMALEIDALVDERDMVIKPLPRHIRKNTLVSGMVTTGKNELISVLHVPVLLERAGAIREESKGLAPVMPPGQAVQRHILVVDDSLNTREIETDVLEAHGYRVTQAQDGLEGLRKARLETFDAVITDVEMPQMDGFTLTQRLREEEAYRDVPIIILSSRQKEEDKRRGIQVGADAYMVKGDFGQTNLVETLRNLGL